MRPESFYPSRRRPLVAALGGMMTLSGLIALTMSSLRPASVLTSLALLLVGTSWLWRARKNGVTLTEEGVSARAASFAGTTGFWKWESLTGIDRREQEYFRSRRLEVVLTSVSNGTVSLDQVRGEDAMIAEVRKRLSQK